MIHLIKFKHVLNANETANVFLKEIYRLHGFPKVVTTDRGVQFTSQVWKELLEFFGTENYDTLPFYKLSTRKYGPFKAVGVDEEKKNYRLCIKCSM